MSKKQTLWRLIALSEHTPPPEPVTQTLQNNLQELLQTLSLLLQKKTIEEGDPVSEQSVQEIEIGELQEEFAPTPNWAVLYSKTLEDTYAQWVESDDVDVKTQIIVAPPYGQIDQTVRGWAQRHEYRIITPPSSAQILQMDKEWLTQWEKPQQSRWVLPALDLCYLRHPDGLGLIRAWLALLSQNEAGLIVCSSWAWSYLCAVLQLDDFFPSAKTIAPLHSDDLQDWFAQLASNRAQDPVTFRHVDGKQLIYSDEQNKVKDEEKEEGNKDGEGTDEGADETDKYFKHLAASSYGIAPIALSIWRHSFTNQENYSSEDFVDPDSKEQQNEDPHSVDPPTEIQSEKAITILPWEAIDLPSLPNNSGVKEAMILHTLLLHGRIPETLFAELLPLSRVEIESTISRLLLAGLIESSDSSYRVTHLGYPNVRSFLNNEGILID